MLTIILSSVFILAFGKAKGLVGDSIEYGGSGLALKPRTPPPSPRDLYRRDPQDNAKNACVKGGNFTTITYNSWLINWGTTAPWDGISNLTGASGPCTDNQCKIHANSSQTSNIFPLQSWSDFDPCKNCRKFTPLSAYDLLIEITQANMTSTAELPAYLSIIQEALKRSNRVRTPKRARLQHKDQPEVHTEFKGDDPNNLTTTSTVTSKDTNQNFNVNYILVERWNGPKRIGSLGIRMSSDLQRRAPKRNNNAGLQDDQCKVIGPSVGQVGKDLSCFTDVPEGAPQLLPDFFGNVSASCLEITF